jgi:hypothetical protein
VHRRAAEHDLIHLHEESAMRSILLWLLGVPLPIIILIALMR